MWRFQYTLYISGRFKKISRTDRLCNLCDDGVVGDEFHYILKYKNVYSRNLYKYAQHSSDAQVI